MLNIFRGGCFVCFVPLCRCQSGIGRCHVFELKVLVERNLIYDADMNKASEAPRKIGGLHRDKYYRELLRKNLLRLALTYLAPLVLLTIYFHFQYRANSHASLLTHLKSIAEYQANTLDLFLRERTVNLANLIDDPRLELPPSNPAMQTYLEKLKKNSDTFVDLGFFNSAGIQSAYAGPLPYLERRDYSEEPWFVALRKKEDNFIITDIYLGFRQKPHFTIAVSRMIGGEYVVLRATLDPEAFYEYITSREGSKDVTISIVNREGYYQLVTPHKGSPLQSSSIIPPDAPRLGAEKVRLGHLHGGNFSVAEYAYAWLRSANWAVIVQWAEGNGSPPILPQQMGFLAFAVAVFLVVLSIIIIRSKRLVELQIEQETTKAQFEHAAKLASVGELSAGVAHEINNPLAVISEEVGLIKDLMNPDFDTKTKFEDLVPHLNDIEEAVFRCRDITRKLLSFVRKTDINLMPHNVNALIDEIVEAFWEHESAVSNIEIIKNYQPNLPQIVTDANQIGQVFLNILTNAVDAITPPGQITIVTYLDDNSIHVAISDTGKGITHEEMEKIFLPFFTTKEVGKGTGLGLSVSYNIVKSLGGKILVESIPKKGSTFTVVLPLI